MRSATGRRTSGVGRNLNLALLPRADLKSNLARRRQLAAKLPDCASVPAAGAPTPWKCTRSGISSLPLGRGILRARPSSARSAPPSLFRAVKLLEIEFGGRLFNRERTNTHLTELGKVVLCLQQVLKEAEEAKQKT